MPQKNLDSMSKIPKRLSMKQQRKMFAWAPEAPDYLDLHTDQGRSTTEGTGPKYIKYFGPVLDALRTLGGAAEPRSVMDKVKELVDISEHELSQTNKGGRSRYNNHVRWARFYLARGGLIDPKVRGSWVLSVEGRETRLDNTSALALVRDVDSRFQDTAIDEDDPAPDLPSEPSTELFDDSERSFWFVGATWGDSDQTEHFLREGIWTNGYDQKFGDHVQRMKPGDRIAIKASFTKKYGLPFDNRDKSVSCMRIKAIGTVTEKTQDGQTVKVDWKPVDRPKDWYFYTYRVTIVEANVADELARRLIRFTFDNQKQDYDFWLRQPYWAKKYPTAPTTEINIQDEEDDADCDPEEISAEPYDIADIVNEGCFLPDTELCRALEGLKLKKNLILQGPPGTGKTWLAKRLGYAIIGTRNRYVTRNRMRVIQFHPSLSYEDFVRGWRPDGDGQLKLIDGVFLEAIGCCARRA